MARVIWTEPSLRDLEEIADYISLDKPDRPRGWFSGCSIAWGNLRPSHSAARCRLELPDGAYRQLVVRPLRVFYRPQGDVVYIVHVMRGERLFRIDSLLEREE